MGFASCQTLFAQVPGGRDEPVSIAICIVTVIAICGAVARLGSARNPKAAMVTSIDPALATIDPAAMMREAKNLPVDPVYPAF
jgi:hypothetical protein